MPLAIGNAIGIPFGGSNQFDPSSITVDGVKILQQQLLTKQRPTINGVILDESKNKGDARPIVTGSDYLFDGTNDYAATTLNFNTFCQNSFYIDIWLNPTDGQPASGQLVLGGQDNGTGMGVQGTLASNGFIVAIETTGQLSFAYKAGGNYALAQTSAAVFVNGAQPAFRKFRFTATAGVGLTISEFLNPLTSNVVTPITLGGGGVNGLFSTNNVVMSSFNYNANLFFGARNSLGTPANFYGGEIFGLEISNALGVDYVFYKCSERVGTVVYDSSGNARHGTLINGVTHSTQNVYSWNNEVGYTAGTGSNGAAVGVFIPRNEANITFDVLGNALQFKGRVPYDALMINSSCVSYNGTTQYALTTCTPTTAGSIETRFILTSLNGGNVMLAGVRDSTDTRCYLSLNNNILAGGIGSQLFSTIFGGGTLTTGVEYTGKIEWTGTTVTLSLNGVVVYTGAQAGSVGSVRPFAIGAFNDNGVFNGFSNARIYNTIFRDGSGVVQGNYATAEGTGFILYDQSGNNRHASLVNAPTWSTQNGFHNNMVNGCSKYMNFNGNNNLVVLSSAITLPVSPWRVDYSVLLAFGTTVQNGYFGGTAGTGVGVFTSSGSNDWQIHDGTNGLALTSISHTIPANQFKRYSFRRTSTRFEVYDITSGSETLVAASVNLGLISTITIDRLGDGSGRRINGTIFDININNANDSTSWTHTWRGFGASNAEWIGVIGGVNGTVTGPIANLMIPARTVTTDAINAPLRNPAGAWHNGCETQIDFRNGVNSPISVINNWATAWAFNTARTNPNFRRTLITGGSDVRADRYLAYREALTGSNLTKVNAYVATKSI